MTITQTNTGVSGSNPSSVSSLEQLNSSTQSSTQTFTQLPKESVKNTPLVPTDVANVLNSSGVSSGGVSVGKELPFITVKTTQTLVTVPTDTGLPSAKPVVLNNKNLNLQPGIGLDGVVNVVLPYARAASIRFQANKLKPNTRYYAFFNEYNVTNFCNTGNSTANIFGFSTTTMTSKLESQKLANVAGYDTANVIVAEQGNIFSDYKGFVSGVFNFTPQVGLKIPCGDILFRLTDSPTNSASKESYADAIFPSIGRIATNVRIPPPSGKPDYGSGGNVLGKPSPGGGGSSGPKNDAYGWIEHHASFLYGVPLNALTNEMKLNAYNAYISTAGGIVISVGSILKTVVPGAKDYNMGSLVGSGLYDFKSGTSASNPNERLSTGIRVGDQKTAINILEAKNSSTGKTFVEDAEKQIRSVGGDAAWKLAVGEYEGTRTLVQQAVNNNKLTPDIKAFWESGVKTGAFNPNSPADIQKAINNYAASVTLGMYKQDSVLAKSAGAATVANGTAPSMKPPSSTYLNSTATSTRKV